MAAHQKLTTKTSRTSKNSWKVLWLRWRQLRSCPPEYTPRRTMRPILPDIPEFFVVLGVFVVRWAYDCLACGDGIADSPKYSLTPRERRNSVILTLSIILELS